MTVFLTALNIKCELVHIITLEFKRRVNISIECNVYIGMTKYFTQSFYLKTDLYASCGECVSQGRVNPKFRVNTI